MAYVSHFCTRKTRKKLPEPLILSSNQNSESLQNGKQRKTYFALVAATVAGTALTLFILTAPVQVDAFWPFTNAKAQDEGEPPILHDATIGLLSAATNIDPNPSKGAIDLEITSDSALIANTGPDGTLPSAGGAGAGAISLYQVREGDSLSEIADMFGVSINTILWANDIKDAKTIQPGDTLLILPVSGVRYTIKKGGTLSDVAKLFDADVEEIALFNGIDPTAPLSAGTELIIPGDDLNHEKTSAPAPKKSSGGTTLARALPALTGFFGNPLPGGRLSQGLHGTNAVDISAPNGTPIYASAGGTVIVAKNNGGYNGGFGNYIAISHANGTQTLYAHMSRTAVSQGATVAKGDVIGYVGITGKATGYHLHFEVRGAKNPFVN